MNVLPNIFFEHVFSELERGELNARYKRRSLVDQLSTLIEGCIRESVGEGCDPQDACRSVILSAIRYHNTQMEKNGMICLMGKYHNILYIAAKLCFDWQLRDTATVACVLNNIYQCERTFERLLMGAFFGTRTPFFISGWKSDFQDQEENVRAMVYFYDHASTAALEYNIPEEIHSTRFIDIPIESCGKMSPVKLILQLGAPDILHILLRFGAVVSEDAKTSGLESLMEKLQEFNGVYPFNLVACLKLLMRAIISVRVCPDDEIINTMGSNVEKDCFRNKFPDFISNGLVPESRCAQRPPELRHLCRCAIRYRLWQNFQLPNGIRSLPVPESLHTYLDLFVD